MRRVDLDKPIKTGSENNIQYRALTIDKEKRRVAITGKNIELTPKEFDLLVMLAQQPGVNFDRKTLLDKVWGYNYAGYEHTVNSHINRLRSKIETDPDNPEYVLTTWGVGYKFNDE
jgi:two-component system alkaline phosphatase synthesis response regulator PhoP